MKLLALLLLATPLFPVFDAGEKAVPLFNGENFDDWVRFLPDENADPDATWKVKENGVYWCSGKPAGYLRTEAEHENYRLQMEWRWPEGGGNNGVLVHVQEKDEVWPKSVEIQLQHENAGDFWVIGGASFKEHTSPVNRRVPKRHPSSEKPLGEWNRCEIICRDDRIEVYINGVLQNVATENTLTRGRIALQSEGTAIEFRNIVLAPLDAE